MSTKTRTWQHADLAAPPETPEEAEHRLLRTMRDSFYAINRCIEHSPGLEQSRLAPLTATMRASLYRMIREIEHLEGLPAAQDRS